MPVSKDESEQPGAGSDRRRFLKGAAAVVGGLAATGAAAGLGVPDAQAEPGDPRQTGLPPIGAEIPCSCLALNTPLHIGTALISVDFRGGIKVRVDVNPDDPFNSVRLRVIGHRVTAELPGDDKDGPTTITIEQNDIDVDAESLLRLTRRFPPRFEQLMVLKFTLTIDRPDRLLRTAGIPATRAAEPLVLTTKDPAMLVGTLTQFPPRGDLYRLQNPVDLVLPDNPDIPIAKIEGFPVKVGGL